MNNILALLLFLVACLVSDGYNVRHETSAGSAANSNRKVFL